MKKQKVWKTLAAWAGQLVLSLLALVGAVRLTGVSRLIGFIRCSLRGQ